MQAEKKRTGYPSIDKPWLKYYSEEAIRAPLPECTIYEYLWENNKDHLDDVALIYFGRKIRYHKLFSEIEQCSNALAALGIQEGDIVTIQSLNLPQVVVLLYALSRIGAIANLIYISSLPVEVADIIKKTNSKLYVTMDTLYSKAREFFNSLQVKNILLLSPAEKADSFSGFVIRTKMRSAAIPNGERVLTWTSFMKHQRTASTKSDADAPVILVYTGGTTGKTKAVVLTNKNVNSIAFQYGNANMGFQRGDCFLDVLPMFIAFGITVSLHLPLCLGIQTILLLDITQEKAGEVFAKYKPNYYVGGAVHIEKIISNPKLQKSDMRFVKVLAAGGDAIPVSLERQANAFLQNHNCPRKMIIGYGMTELSATVCTSSPQAARLGTVGIPMPQVTVKIVDP